MYIFRLYRSGYVVTLKQMYIFRLYSYMQCFKINADIVTTDSGVVCVHVVRQIRFIEGITIHVAKSSSVPRDGAKKRVRKVALLPQANQA